MFQPEPLQVLCLSAWLGWAGAVKPQGWGAGLRLCLTLRLSARLDHSSSSQRSPRDSGKMLLSFDPHLGSLTELTSFTQIPHDVLRQSNKIFPKLSPGDSPAWPVLCYGPARGHFDGAVALGLLPAGSCGAGSASAHPWCWGGTFLRTGTACCFFFQLHALKPFGSETTAYCRLFTIGFGVFWCGLIPDLLAVPQTHAITCMRHGRVCIGAQIQGMGLDRVCL